MPYQIIEEPRFVRLVFTGDITPLDLVALDADMAALARNRPVVMNTLADFSQVVDYAITYADMLTYTERRRTQRFANSIKSAVVAPRPVQVGFARMYQTLNTNPQVEIQIFATLAEAEAWLRADEAAVESGS
jgi:hypothetical protein